MTSAPSTDVDERPVVTVIILTYNHEAFIAQAMEGVLEQRTPFGVELIITEDCSTDATLDVIREVQERTGRPFTLLTSPVNLCSNVVFRRALDIARGEFIATLDGDDYWTDADKLARQVDFLRRRPDFVMCYHDVVTIDDATGQVIGETAHGETELTRCDLVLGNVIPGCSPLIRRSAIARLPPSFDDAEFGDWPLYLEAAGHGRIGGIGATMGAYRIHLGGIWTGTPADVRQRQCLRFLDDLEPSVRRSCRTNWRKSRGFSMRKIAAVLLDQDRRREARPFAFRSLTTPGLPGYGRRESVRLAARSTVPGLYALWSRGRRRLDRRH